MMTEDQLARMFQALPEPEPVVLKLYYNESGEPIVYTSEKLEGNYIEVDPETFAISSMRVRVVNGKLIHIPPTVYVNKLHPSNTGTQCHNNDVAVVVKDSGTYWKRKTYESN
jgi:hypothetical protein